MSQASGHRVAQNRLTWSLTAASTVSAVFVLSNAPTPMYVKWQADWGFSSGTLTVVFAAYMAGLIATLLSAGSLADRYGRRVVLLPGLVAAVLSALLFLLAANVLWLLAARFLAGVSVGAAVTAGMAATVDLAPSDRRRAGSLIASASMVLGAGLGPLLTGVIAESTSAPQVPAFGVVLVLSVLALVVAALLPMRKPAKGGQMHHVRRPWSWPSVPQENRRALAWGIATFAPGITATSFVLSLGPTVLADALGQSSALVAGATACAMFLVATGVQFALAQVATRTHLALSSIAVMTSMAILALDVTIWHTASLFVVAALFAGIGQGLGQLAGLTLIATQVPETRRAEANAALNIAGYIPAALLSVATGYLIDAVGLSPALLMFATAMIAAATTALIAVRRSSRAQGQRGPVPTRTTSASSSTCSVVVPLAPVR